MRSSGQLGKPQYYIQCLEKVGITTAADLRAATPDQLAGANISIGLRNHLLSNI